jgi:hypothetical protein
MAAILDGPTINLIGVVDMFNCSFTFLVASVGKDKYCLDKNLSSVASLFSIKYGRHKPHYVVYKTF